MDSIQHHIFINPRREVRYLKVVYRIKQQLIDSGVDVINISHFGTESAEIMAFNELRFSNPLYNAQNIEIIDNTLTLSNLTKNGNSDFSDFCQSITHNIQYSVIAYDGEYKNPLNVNNQVGCMVNEDYVYAAQLELVSGELTDQVYYIDTIRIDGDIVTNAGNPLSNRRVAGGTADMRIQDADGVRVIYPQFLIDWDGALINGRPVRDVIKSIKIYRAEVVNPRVIACGLVVPCVRDPAALVGNLFLPSSPVSVAPYPDDIFPFPEFAGSTRAAAVTAYPSIYRSEWNGGTEQNFAFYAPDYYFSGNSFSFLTGDIFVLNSGVTDNTDQSFVNLPAAADPSAYNKFYGDQTYGVWADAGALPPIAANPDNPYDVATAVYCPTGSQVDCGSAAIKTFHNTLYVSSDVEDNQWQTYSCHVVTLNTNVDIAINYTIPTAAYGYYIRPRDNQYGDLSLLKYIYTNCEQRSEDVPFLTSVPLEVNKGGDTFNQLSALKQRVKSNNDAVYEWNNVGASFYSQNRVNTQMRVPVPPNYQFYDSLPKIELWLCNVEPETINYNNGYSIYGNDYINYLSPYDPNLPEITEFLTRAVWSLQKPSGSLVDDYRVIPPLNFYDFPITEGAITTHLKFNKQLIFIQPTMASMKYFNSEGQFTTVSGDNVVLGENAVMSRREMSITSFGSRHKQSVVIGKTESGKDNIYWVCSDYKKIMRYGADGVVCLSDRAFIKTWCETNIVEGFNYSTEYGINNSIAPYAGLNSVAGLGICGVWNHKDKEYIVTLRSVSTEDSSIIIGKTISFSEVTNRFVSFYSAWPTIYIPFRDVYLTPDSRTYNYWPTGQDNESEDTGDIYLHNDDLIDNAFKPTYYDVFAAVSTVSIITNDNVINNKLWQNIETSYDGGTPATYGAFLDINFETKTQAGAPIADSELALDFLRGQIGLDSSEKNLSGVWLKTNYSFDLESIGKLLRHTVKYLVTNRLAQK